MSRNLSRREIIEEVTKISEPIAKSLDCELVEVEYIKEFGEYFLRIYIYKDDGVGIDDCQEMSRILSEEIDKKDPIPGAYYLEVSSPGLDRPIKTNQDLNRSINKDIEIRLYQAVNNRKQLEGNLKSYTDEDITIIENEEEIVIPRELISLMRLAIKI